MFSSCFVVWDFFVFYASHCKAAILLSLAYAIVPTLVFRGRV